MALTTTQVSQLYISIFGRASEGTGNTYWSTQHTTTQSTAEAMFALTSVSTFFGVTDFTTAANVRTVIEAIYLNTLGKSPTDDAAGITYWIGKVTGGQSMGSVVVDFIAAAQETVNAGTAQDIFNNKVAVSDYTAATITTFTTAAVFQAYIAGVTNVASTVVTAKAAVLADVPVVSNPGTTFTLTTATDTLDGTAADDLFVTSATYTAAGLQVPASGTIAAADTIDGKGGNDTLRITIDGITDGGNTNGGDTVNLVIPSVSNVETLQIRNVSTEAAAADNINLNATNFTGLTSFISDRSTADMVLINLATGGTVTINGNGSTSNGDLTASYVAAATAGVLNLVGGVTAGATAMNGAGHTSWTVNSKGAANTVGALTNSGAAVLTTTLNAAFGLTTTGLTIGTNAAAQALVISGAGTNTAATSTAGEIGAVALGTLDTDFASIDASGLTAGGVTATLSATVAATFTGGAGNDFITTSTTGHTGAINAGDGTDTLIVDAAVDMDTTTEGAKYTNFETLSVANNQVVSNVAGITGVILTAGGITLSGMNATQAANITLTGANSNTNLYTLTNSSGTTDVLTLNLSNATAATNHSATGISAVGFETVNINATSGVAGTASAFAFTANAADAVTVINVTGAADTSLVSGTIFDVAAMTIDASASTGGHTNTGTYLTGSAITGSATAANTMTLSTTLGTTYTGGALNDVFNAATVADLVATGTSDNVIAGGGQTVTSTSVGDTIVLAATTNTVIDNHFTNVTGMEGLTTSTSTTSITTGAAFNTAFAGGATLVTGTLANTTVYLLAAGLSTVDTTVTVDMSATVADAAVEDTTITTGSGNDTVTTTGTAFIGAASTGGSIVVATGAGTDTISISMGILTHTSAAIALTITGGTGADTITKVGTNNATTTSDGFGKAVYVIADGDSLITGRDVITGFDLAGGSKISDTIDFTSVAGVVSGGASDGTNSGTILSHSSTSGFITFDDINTFATALVINANNLADVTTYLTTNFTTAGDTAAFGYDSNGSGAADSTMVFNAGVGANDSLVELVGVVATTLSATNATTGLMIDVS